jgi:hypothetical protein
MMGKLEFAALFSITGDVDSDDGAAAASTANSELASKGLKNGMTFLEIFLLFNGLVCVCVWKAGNKKTKKKHRRTKSRPRP